jgi:hypothetical protein
MTNAQRSTSTNAATSPAAAAWRIAVSNFEAAKAALAEFDVRYKAVNAASDADPDNEEKREACFTIEREELDPIAARVSDARDRMFGTPAPDVPALVYKMCELNRYLAEVDSEDALRFAQLTADVANIIVEGK